MKEEFIMVKLQVIARTLLCILFVALICEISPADVPSREDLMKRMENSQAYFKEVVMNPDTAIPVAIMKKASGIVILRQLKIGIIIGAKSGGGLAMVRDDETQGWSPPAFVRAEEGSLGLQIGKQTVNAIYMVMSKESMEKLLKGGVKIGIDISARVGPVGKDIEVDLQKAPEMFIYSENKGFYAGASFKAGAFDGDKDANEIFYGRKVSAKDILFNKAVNMPKETIPFVTFLESYASPEKQEVK
jgi:lipid-binding SYLF domain-containing protein